MAGYTKPFIREFSGEERPGAQPHYLFTARNKYDCSGQQYDTIVVDRGGPLTPAPPASSLDGVHPITGEVDKASQNTRFQP